MIDASQFEIELQFQFGFPGTKCSSLFSNKLELLETQTETETQSQTERTEMHAQKRFVPGILVFHDSISDRSVRSLRGFLLLTVACVNDLTIYPQSSKYWKY